MYVSTYMSRRFVQGRAVIKKQLVKLATRQLLSVTTTMTVTYCHKIILAVRYLYFLYEFKTCELRGSLNLCFGVRSLLLCVYNFAK